MGRIRRWRHIACYLVGASAKEVVFHLAQQVLAGAGIGQVQAVFVHQHGLVTQQSCHACLLTFSRMRWPMGPG